MSTIPSALAQGSRDYPTRSITLVVPFAAGGGNDIMARLVGERMTRTLGQQVVIENRAGAGGNTGSRQAARSPPDGYTILLGFTGTLGINPALYANIGYDPNRELTPIGSISTSSVVLVVHPSFPAQNLTEFIAVAKESGSPVSFASSGEVVHIATEMLADAAGFKVLKIPYKGTGPAIADLLGGHVKVMMPPIPVALSYINAGTLRAIGVTSRQRSPTLPDVPTLAEAGLPGFSCEQRYGLLAPAGTPRPVIDRLNRELRAALTDEMLRRRLTEDGTVPAPDTPEEYGRAIAEDQKVWGGIVKKLGLRIE